MTKEEVKQLRVVMQALLDSYWDHFNKTRATSIAYTELEMSRLWMGELLSYLNSPNPYAEKDGNRKTKKDILPSSDVDKGARFSLVGNQIERADALREWLGKYADIDTWFSEVLPLRHPQYACILNIYTHLSQARMYLGVYLKEIKENG